MDMKKKGFLYNIVSVFKYSKFKIKEVYKQKLHWLTYSLILTGMIMYCIFTPFTFWWYITGSLGLSLICLGFRNEWRQRKCKKEN